MSNQRDFGAFDDQETSQLVLVEKYNDGLNKAWLKLSCCGGYFVVDIGLVHPVGQLWPHLRT
jgi:hypothetical protein